MIYINSYNIELDSNENTEEFEVNGDNIAELRVYDKTNNDITNKSKVLFILSKNGLLGLGAELIRLAHKFEDGYHTHLEPSEKDRIVQNLGIVLMPTSCELILNCSKMDSIEEYFEKIAKNLNILLKKV